MLSSTSAARSALPRAAARTARSPCLRQARFQSSSASSAAKNGSSHVASGVAGGVATGLVLYGIYSFTPSGRMQSTINKGAYEASQKYNQAVKKLQQATPEPDQAINYIKEFCYSYVSWVPGGRQYVDTIFKDIDTLRQNHREEVNEIVNDAYKQFQQLSKSGLSLETASKAYDVLADLSKKIGSLAGDALTDIIDNHPQVKDKFGGSIEQLKQMGEQYGPEAKKQVDETWNKVKDVMAGGLTAANLDKARRLVQESVEKVKEFGDQAWKKGLEQAKPYLDKNPKVRELIENNADALKQGNIKELFEKASKAVDSSDLGEFQDYVNSAVDKAKSKGSQLTGGSLDQYLKLVPSGGDILSKMQQLREVAEEHKGDAERLLKETVEEIKQLLEKKYNEAEKIKEQAKKDAKN
jgi:uncharacterized protein Yka (UPF0111/DUF47 family)